VVSGLDADVIAIESFANRAAQPMYRWYCKRHDRQRKDEHQQGAVADADTHRRRYKSLSSVISHPISYIEDVGSPSPERARARVIHLALEASITSRL
jgi:hypothetical protein